MGCKRSAPVLDERSIQCTLKIRRTGQLFLGSPIIKQTVSE
nr:MAG TPA: hypothetical protein [Caudoviricetes sp.]